MLVRYWMTAPVETATEKTTLLEAFTTMKQGHCHRLPVLRGAELCGIVSRSDLYRYVTPSLLRRESIPAALSEELSSRHVAQVMTPSPSTCAPNDPLEEVGARMREQRIGALPVVRDGHLVGIITQTDVLEALTRLARHGSESHRICLRIPVDEKRTILYDLVDQCRIFDLELLTFLTHTIQEESAYLVMFRFGGKRSKELLSSLWHSKYQVLSVT